MALAAGLALAPGAALADSVSGQMQGGYGRLNFAFSDATPPRISATSAGGVLAISFSDKPAIDPAAISAAMPGVIASGHADPDGRTLRFVLNAPVKVHVSQQGGRAVVDLAPADFAGTMPDLPPPSKAAPRPLDLASLPTVKLRAGAYANFTRLVFDWPKTVAYTVFPGAGKLTVRFAAPVNLDVSAIARFAPPWVKNAAWHIEGGSTVAEFETDSDSGFHDFRDGTHVAVDILAPRTDGAAYTPPGAKAGAVKPAVTAMAAPKGVSSVQAQAIQQTAAAIAPQAKSPPPPLKPALTTKTAAATPPPAAAAATPAAAAPTTVASAAPAATPAADGHRTRDGAVISFRGAGTLPAAVFVRGLTAWIVLENGAGFDSGALGKSLGDYAMKVEGATSNGLGILRITLKTPTQITATSYGNDLKVVLGPQAGDPPADIGFARNQADPRRASLSTLLPLADHAFQVQDPSSGDMLTIVPASAGHGSSAPRAFADFAVLPSACGLVLTPFADDLSVSVAQSRVTIARPRGLALTPPQMPVAQSPSALAHLGDGPSYLDFARWGQMSGGSFLATQRALTAAITRQSGAGANGARLNLARFYLANGFARRGAGADQPDPVQRPGAGRATPSSPPCARRPTI